MKTATTEVMGAAKELIPSYPSPAVGPKVRHHDAFTGPHRQSRDTSFVSSKHVVLVEALFRDSLSYVPELRDAIPLEAEYVHYGTAAVIGLLLDS